NAASIVSMNRVIRTFVPLSLFERGYGVISPPPTRRDSYLERTRLAAPHAATTCARCELPNRSRQPQPTTTPPPNRFGRIEACLHGIRPESASLILPQLPSPMRKPR